MQNSLVFRLGSLIIFSAAVHFCALAQAQEKRKSEPVNPGAKMKVTKDNTPIEGERRIAFPSPYARMLGIETALKKAGVEVDWAASYQKNAYRNLKVAELKKDKGTMGVALGVRLADGVIAFMAKDQEKLKSCANDVKALAEQLGVSRDQLGSLAPLIRSVESEDWTEIYWNMGVLQQEIVSTLDDRKDRTMTAVIASGAWLQGIRYASDHILISMKTVDLSNMLRAAPIADLLAAELRKTPADVLALPPVKSSIQVLDAVKPIIDVKIDEQIPAEKVRQLQSLAAEALDGILK